MFNGSDFFITMSTDRKSSANQGASIGWSLKKILLKFIIQWRKPAMLRSLALLRFLHMQLMKVLSYISTINTGWRWREHVIYLLKGLGTDARVGKTKLAQFTPLKCVTTLYESFRATTNLPRNAFAMTTREKRSIVPSEQRQQHVRCIP